jgi:hypothetical protein
MTRAEENIGQSTTAFEPSRNDQDGLIPRKKPTAKYDDGLLSEKSRGDRTRLELFLGGIKALTLQLSIGKIEAACGAGKSSCGDSISTPGSSVALFQPGHAVARFREPDKHRWIVARNDETRIRRNLLHAILRCQV